MESIPVRIVVADDSLPYRAAIRSILQRFSNLQVVAEAADGCAAVQAVSIHRPDIVLMDVSMPVLDGINATATIRSRFPDVRVIIISMHDLESFSNTARQAGACMCLSKDSSAKEIVAAIVTASSG